MSVAKLLSRVITSSDYTFGITNDPLTQFACVFSALIHDVDHPGVPNHQLIVENQILAEHYRNKSVAEQNSLDLAWNLLHEEQFSMLRSAIFRSEDERKRFRQLVVNLVMATDVMDKELKELRNNRWEKAFSKECMDATESQKDSNDRKATIVIEHMIQASDVAHTMQHWTVFRKWNVRLFQEMYKAYLEGRSNADPSSFWYEGEMKFFDFYIIPLANKLKSCGVFGVSSDEYLNFAVMNRKEWEDKGQEIVEQMVEEIQAATRATDDVTPSSSITSAPSVSSRNPKDIADDGGRRSPELTEL